MFKAARMNRHDGHWFLSLGESELAFAVFKRHYPNLSTAQPPKLKLKNSGLALPASSGIVLGNS
jgi:hypothetical protein